VWNQRGTGIIQVLLELLPPVVDPSGSSGEEEEEEDELEESDPHDPESWII
tara:strand:- start:19 stop:171 length:153 start_codon:yes stop_codon:yes gene_type:complete